MQKRRRLAHIAVILIFLAIAVFINLIFMRLDICIDLTENEAYRISDEARSITGEINRKIDVYCFVEDENKADFICEFTRNFCRTSDKFSYRIVDPTEHPEIAKRYTSGGGEIGNNTVVFDNGENYRVIPHEEMLSYNYLTGQNNLLVAEERFCLAAEALNRDTEVKIAILTGHGEEFDEGLGKRVESIGTRCTELDIRNGDISDFDVLMIISPHIDFTGGELEKLDEYLKDGGTIIIALDASAQYHEMLEGFLSEWGIAVPRNMVLSADAGSIMGNQPYSVIGRLKAHPVTDGLINSGIKPVFFASRSVDPLWETHGGIRVTVLAESAENSSAVLIDTQQQEESGAFSLLTLSQGEKGRIFTFGSSMFFCDDLKTYNRDLLRNIITWSTDGELMTEVSPKIITSSNIQVPKSSIIFWIAVFGILIPSLIAAAGIITAIRRRRL